MAEPREIVETWEWKAENTPARMCSGRGGCGHPHYQRKKVSPLATERTWRFCEDSKCDCFMLRTAKA